jgi:DNA repair exonuclease SbcCD ATPase subunit
MRGGAAALTAQIEQLQGSKTQAECPTCGRPFEDYEAKNRAIEARIAKLSKELKAKSAKIEALEENGATEITEFRNEIEAVEAEVFGYGCF